MGILSEIVQSGKEARIKTRKVPQDFANTANLDSDGDMLFVSSSANQLIDS